MTRLTTSSLLRPSLVLNVLLTCGMAWNWVRHAGSPVSNPGLSTETVTPSVSEMRTGQTLRTSRSSAGQTPFQWKELDAPDFVTYVQNLRNVGCPEATIRDIIRGELTELYTIKKQELEREMSTAPADLKAGLEQRLQHLSKEENGLFTTLTANPESPPPLTASSAPPESMREAGSAAPGSALNPEVADPASTSLMIPSAFLVGNDPSQPPPTTELSLTPTHPDLSPVTTAVISQIREDFASAVTEGPQADPSSTVYRERWLSAQQASDDRFSSLFGGDLFIKTQTKAAQDEYLRQRANLNSP